MGGWPVAGCGVKGEEGGGVDGKGHGALSWKIAGKRGAANSLGDE